MNQLRLFLPLIYALASLANAIKIQSQTRLNNSISKNENRQRSWIRWTRIIFFFETRKYKKSVKLAAVAMNPHYHPYSDLSSPHPPSPDNNNYPPLSHHNGHSTLSQMDGHHQGFHHMNGTMKHCAGCGGESNKSFACLPGFSLFTFYNSFSLPRCPLYHHCRRRMSCR